MEYFDQETLDEFANAREVELTTYGRATGKPHIVTTWVFGEGGHVFVTSGSGPGKDWTRNLFARPEGVVTIAGRQIPFRAHHITDPAEARQSAALVNRKYGHVRDASAPDEPLAPFEQATFELAPLSSD